MKKDKIIYWTATILIFLFEGVMPALTSHTEMAKRRDETSWISGVFWHDAYAV